MKKLIVWFGALVFANYCFAEKPLENHYQDLGKCPSEKPLRSRAGCVSCEGDKPVWVLKQEDCNVCPNRVIEGEYLCKNKMSCPTERPMKADDGQCVSCRPQSTAYDITVPYIYNARECAKCALSFQWQEDLFISNENDKWESMDPCVLKNIESINQMIGQQYYVTDQDYNVRKYPVYSCDVYYAVTVSKENCDKCPNRRWLPESNHRGKDEFGQCILKECPPNARFRSQDGSCRFEPVKI